MDEKPKSFDRMFDAAVEGIKDAIRVVPTPDVEAHDAVQRPSHYNDGELETIDAIREALGEHGFASFCRGNVIKYAWRAPLKGSFVEDMRKARWYASMAAGDDPRVYRKDS